MIAKPVVLVAEADREVRSALVGALREGNLQVIEAGDGPYAVRQAFSETPDAAVVNLALPMMNGLELVKILRAASDMVILATGEAHSSMMVVRALDAGADDYVPYDTATIELTARVNAALRRVSRQSVAAGRSVGARDEGELVKRTADLEVGTEDYYVRKDGEVLQLTRIEHLLLRALARRMGEVTPHRYLMTEVWGAEYLNDTHYLRGYIASLRAKVEDNPEQPKLILTEWGVGYRLAQLPVVVREHEEVRMVG